MAVLIPFFFVSWRGAFSSQLIYTAFSIIPLIFLIILHKIFIEFKISPKNWWCCYKVLTLAKLSSEKMELSIIVCVYNEISFIEKSFSELLKVASLKKRLRDNNW